jgi:hypothetical protein
VGLGAAGALAACIPAVAAETAQAPGTIDAAGAWRDTFEAFRAPQVVPASDAEEAILLLAEPPASAAPPAERAAAAAAISQRHAELEQVLAQLGARVTRRYRVLVNGLAVKVTPGRLPAIAALADVEAVVPVTYLAPAAAAAPQPDGTAAGGAPVAPHPATRPAHIALIDAGIDPSHPSLGGGMGPTHPIIGGADLVDGDADPTGDGEADAHGTAMAALVLRSGILEGLPPEKVPRLLAYRVVAPEAVEGRTRPLARSDRVLSALELAVDPNADGDPADRSDVILLGLAQGFGGGGVDAVERAVRVADDLGAVVVAPVGNDGPSASPVGTVGGPAAAPSALSVGALSAAFEPRTATLELVVGAAGAAIGPLPLMGPEPSAVAGPVVVVPGVEGVASGNDPAELVGTDGQSRVQGAIAILGRGGGMLADKARNAARAGAVAVAVWDQAGDGAYPGIYGGADWPIPLIGLGSAQGQALLAAVQADPGLTGSIAARPLAGREPAVASFSSRGPSARGRVKPELVAPGVDRPTAYPGTAPDGAPRATVLTGTSAAAAHVAALALRVRVDRPDLAAVDVRSLLIQAARGVAGGEPVDAGAGLAAPAVDAPVAVDPPFISFVRGDDPHRVTVAMHDLTGRDARYRVALDTGTGEPLPIGDAILVRAGVRRGVTFRVPGGTEPLAGRLLVFAGSAPDPVAWAPFVALAPPATPPAAPGGEAVSAPRVRVGSGRAEVTVAIGRRGRDGVRLDHATVHDVALWLLPAAGGPPLRVTTGKLGGDWPTGTYRMLVSRRLASGEQVPSARYRLRVTATTPDGRLHSADSEPFDLG